MATPTENKHLAQTEQKPAVQEPVAQEPAAAAAQLSREDIDRLAGFADYLQRLNLADYLRLTQKPVRLISINFISGVARGFGMAVGFTLLGALAIYILNQLNVLNLPVIGDLIAQILEYVDLARGMRI